MLYSQDTSGLWSSNWTGTLLNTDDKERYFKKAEEVCQQLWQEYNAGGHAYLRVESVEAQLASYKSLIESYRRHFTDVVILGTGGSSLGGQALAAMKGYGQSVFSLTPRLHFLDNIDPTSWASYLQRLEPRNTGVIAISKSGGTAETLCQLLVTLKHWQEVLGKAQLAHHFAVVTEARPSPLFQLAHHYELPFFEHPADIGGRFSVFSIVGALPALIAGVDLAAFYEGARQVRTRFLDDEVLSEPAIGAALVVGLWQERKMAATVMMPYADKLAFFSSWFRQLWSESLGKQGHGLTPLRALGTVDQHSQLQLYLDGPQDKIYTFFCKNNHAQGPLLTTGDYQNEELAYLEGCAIGDVLDAMQHATLDTLKTKGLPVRVFRLADDNEAVLGGLMMHFMLETIMAAQLINVNAFDQPAVESGKQLARQWLLELKRRVVNQ
jgi:glucose-6-phosphate isomerase